MMNPISQPYSISQRLKRVKTIKLQEPLSTKNTKTTATLYMNISIKMFISGVTVVLHFIELKLVGKKF